MPGGVVMPCFEPVTITAPGRPDSAMAGAKARMPLTTPQRFVPMIRSQVAASENSLPPASTPAFSITRAGGPPRSTAAASASMALRSETSVGTARTSTAARAPTSARAASSASPGRSASQTFMPARAKAFAAARPMPLAAPVTTALWPGLIAGCRDIASCSIFMRRREMGQAGGKAIAPQGRRSQGSACRSP